VVSFKTDTRTLVNETCTISVSAVNGLCHWATLSTAVETNYCGVIQVYRRVSRENAITQPV